MRFDILKHSNNITKVMKQNAPDIMTVTGIVGFFVATGMACNATLKSKEVIDAHNECVEEVKADVDITEEEKKKIVATQYVMTGKELVKNYAAPVVIAGASTALILTANGEHKKREACLIAAYTTVDSAFKKYRKAVVDELGEEKDIQFKHGLSKKKIDIVETDENGKEKKVKKEVLVAPENYECSQYARFFDESCPDWQKDPESNLLYLRLQQQYANDKLKSQGHLFLNEVYDMIGIPRTQAGAVVGWIFDSNNPVGDNFVDFGIYDIWNERKRDFVNGYETNILLDFNVDGVIYDKI